VESLVIGKVRRLTDEHDKKDLSWEEDEIGLETKVGLADLIGVGEREKIIVRCLVMMRGQHPSVGASRMRQGRLINKQCIERKR
jgi:hypothetical protein